MSKPDKDDLEAVRVIVDALNGFEANDQERILRWAREKLGLALTTAEQKPRLRVDLGPAPVLEAAASSTATAQSLDIKSFVAKKNPNTDSQFAATIAYYYRFEAPPHLSKEGITKDDLQEACRQVGRHRIKHAAQTLVNAHTQGLLNRGERGLYTINTVGENLVALALPTGATTQQARGPAKKKAKRRKG